MDDQFAGLLDQQQELKAWVEGLSPDQLAAELRPLTQQDYALIGAFVQLICFADFNIRRAANALQMAPGRTGRRSKVYWMQDSQVIDYLIKLIREVDVPPDERDAGAAALEFISRMSELRHHLAHWATKRFPQANAFIMMTMNAKEGHRRSGIAVSEEDALTYGVLFVSELERMIPHLSQASDELARLAPAWVQRFIQFEPE